MKDPTVAAYLEARNLGWGDDEIVILSLGTGRAPERSFLYKDAVGWGALGWLQPSKGAPLMSILADAQSQTTSDQARQLFAELPNVTYHRLDADLPPEAEDIDNARPGNIITLNGAADRVIRDNTVLLDEIAEMLKAQAEIGESDAETPDLVHAA